MFSQGVPHPSLAGAVPRHPFKAKTSLSPFSVLSGSIATSLTHEQGKGDIQYCYCRENDAPQVRATRVKKVGPSSLSFTLSCSVFDQTHPYHLPQFPKA